MWCTFICWKRQTKHTIIKPVIWCYCYLKEIQTMLSRPNAQHVMSRISNTQILSSFAHPHVVLYFRLYIGSQWGPMLFVDKNMHFFIFHRIKKFIQVWNDMRVSKYSVEHHISFLTGMKARLWGIEVQCVQRIVLLFNNIPIIQATKRHSKKKKQSD